MDSAIHFYWPDSQEEDSPSEVRAQKAIPEPICFYHISATEDDEAQTLELHSLVQGKNQHGSVDGPAVGVIKFLVKQINTLVGQISDGLSVLGASLEQKETNSADFVLPQMMETKKRRWADFAKGAGRTLFSLQREIMQLERCVLRDVPPIIKDGKNARLVTSCTRTLHRLILGLKGHIPEGLLTSEGKKLFTQLANLFQRLQRIMSDFGIALTSEVKVSVGEAHVADNSDSCDLILSQIDSDIERLIQPAVVREKIARLASRKFGRTGHSKMAPNSARTTMGKKSLIRDSNKEMIIRPLRGSHSKKIAVSHRSNRLVTPHEKQLSLLPDDCVNSKLAQEISEQVVGHLGPLLMSTENRVISDKTDFNSLVMDGHSFCSDNAVHTLTPLFDRLCILENDLMERQSKLLSLSEEETKRDFLSLDKAIVKANELLSRVLKGDSSEEHWDVMSEEFGLNWMERLKYDRYVADKKSEDNDHLDEWDLNMKRLNEEHGRTTIELQEGRLKDRLQEEKSKFWNELVKRGFILPPTETTRMEGASELQQDWETNSDHLEHVDFTSLELSQKIPKKSSDVDTENSVKSETASKFDSITSQSQKADTLLKSPQIVSQSQKTDSKSDSKSASASDSKSASASDSKSASACNSKSASACDSKSASAYVSQSAEEMSEVNYSFSFEVDTKSSNIGSHIATENDTATSQ